MLIYPSELFFNNIYCATPTPPPCPPPSIKPSVVVAKGKSIYTLLGSGDEASASDDDIASDEEMDDSDEEDEEEEDEEDSDDEAEEAGSGEDENTPQKVVEISEDEKGTLNNYLISLRKEDKSFLANLRAK